MQQLDFIFDGGYSKRYHTVDTLRTQDIAAHSFGVAWLCELLTEGKASKNLVLAALAHDLAEHVVGDIPSPAKRALGLKALFDEHETELLHQHGLAFTLTDDEKRILTIADMMEGMLFCIRERELGNRKVAAVFDRFTTYAAENKNLTNEREYFIMGTLLEKWEKINGSK